MEDIILDEEFIEEEFEEEFEYKPIQLYHFDKITKEYLYSSLAEIDPEESRLKEKFVPLLSAFSTLLQPPEYKENEIPIYQSHNEEQTITEEIPIFDDETG